MDKLSEWLAFARPAPVILSLLCLPAPASAQPDDHAALALSLVNEARAERGLDPLDLSGPLMQAAEAHAEDMLARDYYSHTSPDGGTVRDRVLAAGGDPWRVVAENIATCAGCDTPPGADRVRAFHSGWMQSAGHRENILAPGYDSFGFAMAGADGRAYAVQTFAGPGTPPGGTADAAPADAATVRAAALEAANAARAGAGAPPLQSSDALHAAAERIAAEASLADGDLALPSDPFAFLPDDTAGWRQLAVNAAACGGCGADVVASDGSHFAPRLLPPDAAGLSHMGFAVTADGSGRKIAVALFGAR